MIVPSIDLQGGHAVQLIGGRELSIDGGDAGPWLRRFRVAGEVAVIDLDAAISGAGRGDNRQVIEGLVRHARCRVGGGIRDAQAALDWLDRGAEKVILGTAARPEVLTGLPRARVIAALDAEHGQVMVEGWRRGSGRSVEERIDELRPLVGGFLITFIEREGRMGGIDAARMAELVRRAGDVRVTFAGGIASAADVAAIDRLGADAQVGMALYSGRLDLGEALAAPLCSDRPDGLWPTVVVDERGRVLGLCYSSAESVREAVRSGAGVYHSRRRGLWRKGEGSGDTQELLEVRLDCDRDALCFVVRQRGRGFCHLGTYSCFGAPIGHGLAELERTIAERKAEAPAGSYTRRLFDEPGLLEAKLREEAAELCEAPDGEREQVLWEAADLLYFALVRLGRAGVPLAEVEAELLRRSRRVRRRGGNRKDDRKDDPK